jgi:hypothetical protein
MEALKVPCSSSAIDHAQPRITRGPSSKDWSCHQEEIIRLYRNSTLSGVRHQMQVRYKFVASKRMYDARFKDWNVIKNTRREQGSRPRRKTNTGYNQPSASDNGSHQARSVMRHARFSPRSRQSMLSTGRQDILLAVQVIERTPDKHHEPSAGALSSWEESSPSSSLMSSETCSSFEIVLTPTSSSSRTSDSEQWKAIEPLRFFDTQLRKQEMVMCSVASYFKSRICEIPVGVPPNQIISIGSSEITQQFWANIENGI